MTESEINVKVAELRGWTRHAVSKQDPFFCEKCRTHYNSAIWRAWEIPGLWCLKDGSGRPPDFATCANAALELVETMRAKGWVPEMPPNCAAYDFSFHRQDPDTLEIIAHSATAETLPLAIAKAFIAAHEGREG